MEESNLVDDIINNVESDGDCIKTYTLKILFSTMLGCELELASEDYFLFIKPRKVVEENYNEIEDSVKFSKHTLYIPYNESSPNILLRLKKRITIASAVIEDNADSIDELTEDESSQDIGFEVEIFEKNETIIDTIYLNKIFNYQDLFFAIKESEQEWDDSILKYQPSDKGEDDNLTLDNSVIAPKKWFKNKIFLIALLLVPLIIIFLIFNKTALYREHNQINKLLKTSEYHFDLEVDKKDNKIYILSSSKVALQWLKVTLINNNLSDMIKLCFVPKQKNDTISEANKNGFPVFQLAYYQDNQVVVYVYARLNNLASVSLINFIKKTVPFANQVDIKVIYKQQLLNYAKNILNKIDVNYHVITSQNGYALIVYSQLGDVSLFELRKFIGDFYKNWGNKVIYFSINLEDNYLLNKSYMLSQHSYVYLSPNNWYFVNK